MILKILPLVSVLFFFSTACALDIVAQNCRYCLSDSLISYAAITRRNPKNYGLGFNYSRHKVQSSIVATKDLGIRFLDFHNNKSLWISKANAFPSVNLSLSLDPKLVIQTKYAYHFASELPPTNFDALINQQKNNFVLGVAYKFG